MWANHFNKPLGSAIDTSAAKNAALAAIALADASAHQATVLASASPTKGLSEHRWLGPALIEEVDEGLARLRRENGDLLRRVAAVNKSLISLEDERREQLKLGELHGGIQQSQLLEDACNGSGHTPSSTAAPPPSVAERERVASLARSSASAIGSLLRVARGLSDSREQFADAGAAEPGPVAAQLRAIRALERQTSALERANHEWGSLLVERGRASHEWAALLAERSGKISSAAEVTVPQRETAAPSIDSSLGCTVNRLQRVRTRLKGVRLSQSTAK
eukprot:gnl/TRDRNA2_/TRDRNA2_140823_c1_seq1.p1 gnl/TRDRNA2_/TRDRNA2_140823_c1~~gnl/TRDRNA2_/TRDRNA2_140823_c1_seq1.p1  ORF type:complete len:286 (+),score=44.52 gnl/TRDRNA2_/TRDRNA2_140823_c1_seq1:30-860(+)